MSLCLKKIVSLLLLFLLTANLTGCWDRRELEEQAFVLTLGLDKGSVAGSYIWTFQLALPRAMAGGTTGGGGASPDKPSINVSVEATTLFGAVNLLNSFIDRKANLMHAKVMVVSEEVARKDPVPLRTFIRYREIRRNIFIMVSEGKAKDIIATYRPVVEQNPAKFIETLILNSTFTGLMPNTQLTDYLIDQESKAIETTTILVGKTGGLGIKKLKTELTAPYLPGEIPREGGNDSEIIGVAIFHGKKMVGKLNGSENRVMGMLNGRFKRGFVSFPDPQAPGKFIAVDFRAGTPPQIKINLQGKRPIISIHLSLEGDILTIQSEVDYTRPDMLKKLEKAITKIVTDATLKTVKKTQAMQTDIFGFGNQARHSVNTWGQWEKLNWKELYPQAETKVTVDFAIRRIGIMYQPIKPTK
ncbi:MAG: Ger(x)C family spore germination protein [Carboxydocellales bacterium]